MQQRLAETTKSKKNARIQYGTFIPTQQKEVAKLEDVFKCLPSNEELEEIDIEVVVV